ncbi:MAG: glycosyltransferase family 39 protein, partial [Deltaproteobacteria bacterium]|nr:glycosyltransferase family 39 protein [Deltaproteobacteria bacterium]
MTAGQRSSRRLWALMGTLACAHAVLSGALAPGWRFAKYPHLAEGLARGSLTAAEVGDASALYLLLNTWIAPGTLRWIQTVAAAAGVLLVFVLGRRLRGPVAGVTAAALYAFAQQVVLFSSVLEPDCFISLVMLAALTLALVARPSLWRSVGTGVLLGLAVSLRPTAALVVLVALLVEWRSWRRVSRGRELLGRDVHGFAGAWTPSLRATALLAGVCGLTALAPHLLLELREAHELKAAMSAGQVVHQGHRPEGSGVGPTFPLLLKLIELDEARLPDHKPDHQHELYRKLAMADLGPARPTEVERYWFAKTQAFLREHPWAFVQQLGRKVVLGLAVPDHDTDIPEVIELTQAQQVPLVPIVALVFAGLSGALLCVRRSRVARAVALAALSSQAVALVFFAQARYGLDVLPLWCVLAGGGAAAPVAAARQVGRRLREEGAAGPETIAPAVLPSCSRCCLSRSSRPRSCDSSGGSTRACSSCRRIRKRPRSSARACTRRRARSWSPRRRAFRTS